VSVLLDVSEYPVIRRRRHRCRHRRLRLRSRFLRRSLNITHRAPPHCPPRTLPRRAQPHRRRASPTGRRCCAMRTRSRCLSRRHRRRPRTRLRSPRRRRDRAYATHIPYPSGAQDRSFHHGRFIQNLRAHTKAASGVDVIEATVTDLHRGWLILRRSLRGHGG
jgi:hypothetical protein